MPNQPQPYSDEELQRVFGARVKRTRDWALLQLTGFSGVLSAERIVWLDNATHRLNATIDQLKEEIARKDEALREITKREGEFSLDRLEHAHNTIEHAVQLATGALAPAPPPQKV